MLLKSLLLFGLIAAAVLAVYYFYNRSSQPAISTIELENIPSHYCPTKAWVIVTPIGASTPLEFDDAANIDNCRSLKLDHLVENKSGQREIWLKLPGALAQKISVNSLVASVGFSPRLGDVNKDNIIDETDRQLIETELLNKSEAKSVDVDGDGQVTVLDLSLARINAGIGTARPDGRDWQQDE